MKLEEKFVITLTLEEAQGLKIILGKESDASKKEKGLNDFQCIATSNLYDLLPHKEE